MTSKIYLYLAECLTDKCSHSQVWSFHDTIKIPLKERVDMVTAVSWLLISGGLKWWHFFQHLGFFGCFFFVFCTTVHVSSQRSGSYYVRHSINTLQDVRPCSKETAEQTLFLANMKQLLKQLLLVTTHIWNSCVKRASYIKIIKK